MIVIGVDPDTAGHGVAVYRGGKLVDLQMLKRPELKALIGQLQADSEVLVSMEDVARNTSTWRAGRGASKAAAAKMGHAIGRLHQSQLELELDLMELKVPVIKQAPSSGWKDTREVLSFKQATGWDKKSNKDTRSAAFMGWIAIRAMIRGA